MDEKRKKKLTERITKGIEENRKLAVSIEASMQKRIYEIEAEREQHRVSKSYRERTMPQNRLKEFTSKSKEEVIQSGTPEEIAFLYLAVPQKPKQEKEGEFVITDAETEYMRKRLSDEEAFTVARIGDEYNAFEDIEQSFKAKTVNFLKDIAVLTIYVRSLSLYEREAQALTIMFHSNSPANIAKGRSAEEKKWLIEQVAGLTSKTFEGIDLSYDEATGIFSLDYSDKSSLMDIILYRATRLKSTLRDLKGYIEAIERKLKALGRDRTFLPVDMDFLIADTKSEATIKGYNVPEKYYRSYLNQRIAKGEQVTESDIRKAVYPDYDELLLTEAEEKMYDKQIDEYFVR